MLQSPSWIHLCKNPRGEGWLVKIVEADETFVVKAWRASGPFDCTNNTSNPWDKLFSFGIFGTWFLSNNELFIVPTVCKASQKHILETDNLAEATFQNAPTTINERVSSNQTFWCININDRRTLEVKRWYFQGNAKNFTLTDDKTERWYAGVAKLIKVSNGNAIITLQ